MEFYYGDELIWRNPAELGHFGIKLRKQIHEQELADRIVRPGGELMIERGVFAEVPSNFSPGLVALWFSSGTLEDLKRFLREREAGHLDIEAARALAAEEVEKLALTDYELGGIAAVITAAASPKPWTLTAKHLRTYPR